MRKQSSRKRHAPSDRREQQPLGAEQVPGEFVGGKFRYLQGKRVGLQPTPRNLGHACGCGLRRVTVFRRGTPGTRVGVFDYQRAGERVSMTDAPLVVSTSETPTTATNDPTPDSDESPAGSPIPLTRSMSWPRDGGRVAVARAAMGTRRALRKTRIIQSGSACARLTFETI
jgi:hypothetical protein